MENDDGSRPSLGVVVSLLDLGNGRTRVTIDDVRSEQSEHSTTWKLDCFYTHKQLDSVQLDNMTLPEAEYQGLGVAVLARLLALNGRIK
jgi:hypothetical protein